MRSGRLDVDRRRGAGHDLIVVGLIVINISVGAGGGEMLGDSGDTDDTSDAGSSRSGCRGRACARRLRRLWRLRDDLIQDDPQAIDAGAAARDDGDDGAAEMSGQPRRIQRQTATLREVDHVQRDQHRPIELQQLADQHQVAREVAGIDDHQDRIRRAIKAFAEQHAAAEARFRGVEVHRVDARQIDDLDRLRAGVESAARLAGGRRRSAQHRATDARGGGGAGEVRGFGAGAAETVEEGRLPGVRVADQRDARRVVRGMDRDRRGGRCNVDRRTGPLLGGGGHAGVRERKKARPRPRE